MSSKVVEIPELLTAIFEVADRGTLGRCARVSRLWSELSLDALWKHLPTIFPPLNLLGLRLQPITSGARRTPRTGEGTYVVIDQTPSEAQWKRLFMYAPRVKTLFYSDTAGNLETLFRPEQPTSDHPSWNTKTGKKEILPYLVELSWKSTDQRKPNLLHILPFIGKSLKVLNLPYSWDHTQGASYSHVITFLMSLIRWQGTLELLDLGSIVVDPRTPTAQPLIRELFVKQRSLRRISLITLDFPHFSKLIKGTVLPFSLTELEILDEMFLLRGGAFNPSPPHIQPLFVFQSLTQVVIWVQLPILLPLNIVEMASAWPQMKHLFLTSTRGHISLLLDLAASMPSLESLGFEVLWTDSAEVTRAQIRETPKLGRLRVLRFGVCRDLVPEVDTDAAARLIVAVCPEGCRLMTGWHREETDSNWMTAEGKVAFNKVGLKVQDIHAQQRF